MGLVYPDYNTQLLIRRENNETNICIFRFDEDNGGVYADFCGIHWLCDLY
jgi:hypothetical protein